MAIRTVTPYAGNLPDIAQGQAAFDAAVNTLLPYLTSVMPGGINNTVADINAFASTLGALSSVILNGTGSPSSIVGQDGNYYIDTANGDLYYKTSGAWELKGNLKGPAGSNPSTHITNAGFGVWSNGTLESAVSSVNMITNGEFETDVSGWTAGNGATLARDTSNQVNGSGCLRVTNSGATQGMAFYPVITTPGHVYKVCCSCKRGTTTNCGIAAATNTSTAIDIGYVLTTSTTSVRLELMFEAVGATTYIAAFNDATSNGVAYFDSITLYDMGANLVTNGTFNTDASGWLSYGAGSIVPVTGGINGNCAQVTVVASGYSYQQVTGLTVGKLYRLCGWLKNGGGTGPFLMAGSSPGTYDLLSLNLSFATLPSWTFYYGLFEATSTTTYISMTGSSANSFLFDSITLTEVTVGCVDYNAKALELWNKDNSACCWRETIDTKEGSYYALRVYNGAVYWSDGQRSGKPEFYRKYAGRAAAKGLWVKCSAANKARIGIQDSAGTTWSSYHTGGGAWEWLEVTRTPAANITSYQIVLDSGTATEARFSQPQLQFGSSIGQGNFVPMVGEWVYFDRKVSAKFNQDAATYSTFSPVKLSLQADTLGTLPKYVKSVSVQLNFGDLTTAGIGLVYINASGSAVTSYSVPSEDSQLTVHRVTSSFWITGSGIVRCTSDCAVYVGMVAGGTNTGKLLMHYTGVQL